ncbi:MAG: radical SAM/SPASM domain-containing protein [Archaeoglobales archaeon]|nr:MAG: radical SAM/SPASM domain-containing protein [Archaeoglobales archaeon]
MDKPLIVFWEVTRACLLACKHCRAKAQKKPHPDELKLEECYDLIDQLRRLNPLLIVTGGDPLMRSDLFDILEYADGMRVAIAFSGTKLATKDKLKRMHDLGISRIAVSIDGSNPEIHDHFRGKTGTFEMSMKIIEFAREVGLSTQINTTVTRFNIFDLPNVMRLCLDVGVDMWDVFFVVPTGRAKPELMPSARDFEDVLCWLYDVGRRTSLNVKSSAACHLRRIEIMRDSGTYNIPNGRTYYELLKGLEGFEGEGMVVASRGLKLKRIPGITDGRGMLFVSHVGDVYPSGFLPLKAGNIRERSLIEIYNESKIFIDLRDPERLKGKCGRCQFKEICGGSRARAYAVFGDYLMQEPKCIYTGGRSNR